MAVGLNNSFQIFQDCFKVTTHSQVQKAFSYLKGLFKSEKNRANCQNMSTLLGEQNHQNYQHLLVNSPWDFKDVFFRLEESTLALMAEQEKSIALLVDEVGFRKKGNNSACVGRQYLGSIGKHDNGQVAVVAGFSQEGFYCPIEARLFMPKKWDTDIEKRRKAGIPDQIKHQSKPEMALEMILSYKARGTRFDYVNFDALYGSSLQLLHTLDKESINFMGDIKENIRVFTQKPIFELPDNTTVKKRGRKRKYPFSKTADTSVKMFAEKLSKQEWHSIILRDGTKKEIKAQFHSCRVWVCVNSHTGELMELKLLIRKDEDGKIKYSLSNMMEDRLDQLAVKQGERVFVEKIFEEGKNQVGMGDYQVRKWSGYHKHMAICFIGLYYIFEQKMILKKKNIKITAPIIRKLVASTIESKWNSLETAINLAKNHLTEYIVQISRNKSPSYVT